MKIPEKVRQATGRASSAFAVRPTENFGEIGYYVRGDVFFKMYAGGVVSPETLEWERELRNLVVADASILIARLMKDSAEPPHGIFALAVGTGDSGWNPMAPPAPTSTQRSLYSEITRKTFSDTRFVDADGVPVAYPTKVVDFTTIFTEAEAVGPLVEMGLIGGNVSSNLSIRNPVLPANGSYDPTVNLTNYDTLVNFLSFPVVNKPATSTFEITWRLSF